MDTDSINPVNAGKDFTLPYIPRKKKQGNKCKLF